MHFGIFLIGALWDTLPEAIGVLGCGIKPTNSHRSSGIFLVFMSHRISKPLLGSMEGAVFSATIPSVLNTKKMIHVLEIMQPGGSDALRDKSGGR